MPHGITNPYRDSPIKPTPLPNCSNYRPRSIFLTVVAILAFVTIVTHKFLSSQISPEINLTAEKPASLRGPLTPSQNLPPQIKAEYSVHKAIPIIANHGHHSWPKDGMVQKVESPRQTEKPELEELIDNTEEHQEVASEKENNEILISEEKDPQENLIPVPLVTSEQTDALLQGNANTEAEPDKVETTRETPSLNAATETEKVEPTAAVEKSPSETLPHITEVEPEKVEPTAAVEKSPSETLPLSTETETNKASEVNSNILDLSIELERIQAQTATLIPTQPSKTVIEPITQTSTNSMKPVKTDLQSNLIIPGYPEELIHSMNLWLTAENGVVLDARGNVRQWNDQSSRNVDHSFVSMPPSRIVQSNSALINEYRSDIQRHPENADIALPSQQYTSHSLVDSTTKVASVNFPCAMVSSNESFVLDESSTLFFVIKSEYPGIDERSPGQKFFGHFPSGQFKFLKGEAIFQANGVDYHVSDPKSTTLRLNEWNIVAYRFTRIVNKGVKVEISVNGGNFEKASPSEWTVSEVPVLFSKDSPLYVGGVSNACGFIGKIAEIVMFDMPLSDTQGEIVLKHLQSKYSISRVIRTETNQKDDKLVTLTTDSEVEIEITKSGVKTSIEENEKTNNVKNQNPIKPSVNARVVVPASRSVPNPQVEERPVSSVTSPLIDPIVLEKEEADKRKAERRSNENQVQRLSQPNTERIRQPIVDQQQAGIGIGKGDETKDHPVCASNVDPYKDVPIETFVPPRNADIADVLAWEDAVHELQDRIRQMTTGGKPLRDLMKKEVRTMQILRFKTFCKYY